MFDESLNAELAAGVPVEKRVSSDGFWYDRVDQVVRDEGGVMRAIRMTSFRLPDDVQSGSPA